MSDAPTIGANEFYRSARTLASIQAQGPEALAAIGIQDSATANAILAAPLNAAKEAELYRRSRITGTPVEVLRHTPDVISADAIKKLPPSVVEYLADNRTVAGISKGDYDNLSVIDKAAVRVMQFARFNPALMSDTWSAAQYGKNLHDVGELAYRRMWNQLTPDEEQEYQYRLHNMKNFQPREDWIGRFAQGPSELVGQMFGTAVDWKSLPIFTAVLGASAIVGTPNTDLAFKAVFGIDTARIEAGQAYIELSDLKDETGQPMDPELIRVAAMSVGIVNGLIEVVSAGEWLKLLRGAPGGKETAIKAVSGSVKRALQDATVRAAIRKVMLQSGKAVGTEVLQENLQEISLILANHALSEIEGGQSPLAVYLRGGAEPRKFEAPSFNEAVQRLKDITIKTAIGSAALGFFPAAFHSSRVISNAIASEEFYNQLVGLKQAVDASETQRLSPEAIETFFQTMRMDQAEAPADAMLELLNGDPQLAAQLGIDPEVLARAAANGQTVSIDLGKLAARTENEAQFSKVAKLLQPDPKSPSVQSVMQASGPQDMANLLDTYSGAVAEAEAFNAELSRIQQEIVAAGYPEDVASSTVDLFSAAAHRLALSGRPLMEFLQSIQVQLTDKLPGDTAMRRIAYQKEARSPLSSQRLGVLRKAWRDLAREGGPARFWYQNSSRAILAATRGNLQEADILAQLLAITSPKTPVDKNLDAAIKLYHQWKTGVPLSDLSGHALDAFNSAAIRILRGEKILFTHEEIEALPYSKRKRVKVSNFYTNLMSEIRREWKQGSTNDLWMSRAFGLDSDAISDSQYDWITREVRKIASDFGWTVEQAQAAIWSSIKARWEKVEPEFSAKYTKRGDIVHVTKNGREETKFRTREVEAKYRREVLAAALKVEGADVGRAGYSFHDYFVKNVGQLSLETRPGDKSGVLPGIGKASYAQLLEYHKAILDCFVDPATGRDWLADRLGMLSLGMLQTPGAWLDETNPTIQYLIPTAKQSLIDISEAEKAALRAQGVKDISRFLSNLSPRIDTATRNLLNDYAVFFGLLTSQNAVAWHKLFAPGAKSRANAVRVDFGHLLTPEETRALAMRVAGDGVQNSIAIVTDATGARLLNVGEWDNKEFQEYVDRILNEMFGSDPNYDITPELFQTDSGYFESNREGEPYGKGYRDYIEARERSDLLREAETVIAPRIADVNKRFAEKYGWGDPIGRQTFFQRESTEVGVDESREEEERVAKAKAEGFTYGPVLHGTPRFGFTKFERAGERDYGYFGKGFTFTEQAPVAEWYSNAQLRPGGQRDAIATVSGVYRVMLDVGKMFNMDTVTFDELKEITQKLGRDWSDEEIKRSVDELHKPQQTAAESYQQAARAVLQGIFGTRPGETLQQLGYDSVRNNNGLDIVVFDANRIRILNAPDTLLQEEEEVTRGYVEIADDKYLINIMARAGNISTLVHETGHVFLNEMQSLIKAGLADPAMLSDWQTVLGWLESDGTLTTEQHEKFAEGFVTYLMEGKAPSQRLESAFGRFRRWLLAVYQQATGLRTVELTPEIRGVFSRLLATEREAAAETADLGISELSAAEVSNLGLTPVETSFAATLMRKAQEGIAERLQRKRARGRGEALKRLESLAKDSLEKNDPIYRLRGALFEEGLDADQLRIEFGFRDTFGLNDDTVNALRKLNPRFVKTDGRGLAETATEFGFANVGDMVYSLLNSPTREEMVQERVNQLAEANELENAAEDAVAEEPSLDEWLDAISRYIARKRRIEHRGLSQAALTAAVREQMADRQMALAARPDRFMGNVRRLLTDMRRLIAAGKLEEAMALNQQARTNLEFARQARAIRDDVRDLRQKARGWARTTKHDMDQSYHLNLMSVLMRFGMLRPSESQQRYFLENLQHKGALQGLLEGTDATPFPDVSAAWSAWLLDERNAKPFPELKVAEYEELSNLLNYLAGKGKEAKQLWIEDAKMSAKELAQLCAEPMSKLKNKWVPNEFNPLRRLVHASRSFFSSIDNLYTTLVGADGYANISRKGKPGPNETYIWNKLADADSEKRRLRRKMHDALKPLIQKLQASIAQHPRYVQTDVAVPTVLANNGQGWTFERVFMVALNLGNSKNRQEVMAGYGLDANDVAKLVSVLSDEDWDTVQAIWDTLDTLWPAADRTFYRLNYYHSRKVQAEPFITPSGKKLNGGYFPLRYDRKLSNKAQAFSEFDELKSIHQSVFLPPTVRSGHMQARVSGVVGVPVKLSLAVVDEHVEYMIHYITHAEIIRNLDRVTQTEAYAKTMTAKLGEEVYQMIRPTLRHIARGEGPNLSFIDKLIESQRGLMTLAKLGFNPAVALKQPFSVFGFIDREGVVPLVRGFADLIQHPVDGVKAISDLSPYMADRFNTAERETARQMRLINTRGLQFHGVSWANVKDAGLIMIRAMDLMTVLPMWKGIYEREMIATDGDVAAAVRAADEAVAATQPSTRPIDMSYVQYAKGLHRLFTMFSTFTMKYGNLQRQSYRAWRAGQLSSAEYFRSIVLQSIIPPILMRLMFLSLWGGLDEDDLGEDLAYEVAAYQFIGLPYFRDIAYAAQQRLRGRPSGQTSPALGGQQIVASAAGDMLTWISDLDDDAKQDRAIDQFAGLVSYVVGVPAWRVAKDLKEGMRQFEERGGGPLDVPNIFINDPEKKQKR